MNEGSRPPVTVEDLLKLKRLERPGPEFWTRFERELRDRQLAAIVTPRPWWSPIAPAYCAFVRHRMAFASASLAILAVGVGYRTWSLANARSIVAPAPMSEVASAAPAPSGPVAVAVAEAEPTRSSPVAQADEAPAPVRVVRLPARSPNMLLAQSYPLVTNPDDVPSAPVAADRFGVITRSLALGLGAAQLAAIPATRGFASEGPSVAEAAPVTDPLTQMASPAEERRSRLRDAEAFSAMAGSSSMVMPASERLISRLDDRASSSVGRYNLVPERDAIGLSIRF